MTNGPGTGRKKFRTLVEETMTPAQIAEARAMADEMRASLPLHELRRARELSQATLAELLEMDQGNLSKLEQRTDMYVSTLRRYVEALGGELEIVARFRDREYKINQFRDLDESADARVGV